LAQKKTTYKVTPDGGGFGGQYHRFMAGVAFCEYNGYEYVHKPITAIGHGESADRLNKFIGIPPAAPSVKADIAEDYPRVVYREPDTYFTPAALDKIRGYYYSTPKPADCEYDIAIHIRRGDVGPRKHRMRYTSNRTYKKIIRRLNADFPNSSICVYSVGAADDFKDLAADNVHFCLNGEVEEAFHAMVTAKVLVTSKSAFPLCAALLSTNTVYYLPFWHPPMAHWRVIKSPFGEFAPAYALALNGFRRYRRVRHRVAKRGPLRRFDELMKRLDKALF